jgi:hypothetical protein
MDTETLRIKVPTYKTVIEIDGQDLVLNFRQLKRNERMKLQIDGEKIIDLASKENITKEEQEKVKKAYQEMKDISLSLLESISGDVSILGEKVTLQGLKNGDFPDWIYELIENVYKDLVAKLSNLKAEANSKNEGQHSGSQNA